MLSTGAGYASIIPDAPGADSHALTKKLSEKVGEYIEQYIEAMEKVLPFLLDGTFAFTSQFSLCFYFSFLG